MANENGTRWGGVAKEWAKPRAVRRAFQAAQRMEAAALAAAVRASEVYGRAVRRAHSFPGSRRTAAALAAVAEARAQARAAVALWAETRQAAALARRAFGAAVA